MDRPHTMLIHPTDLIHDVSLTHACMAVDSSLLDHALLDHTLLHHTLLDHTSITCLRYLKRNPAQTFFCTTRGGACSYDGSALGECIIFPTR